MPKTLLLADDSVTIQKVVGITFANEDVELVTVDNGDEALLRARAVKPDLLLADVAMPGLSGYELCRAIRQDDELAHIPVLLLSGTFETFDERRAADVGANGHIAKPFEAQALIDQVNALLAEAEAAAPMAKLSMQAEPIAAEAPETMPPLPQEDWVAESDAPFPVPVEPPSEEDFGAPVEEFHFSEASEISDEDLREEPDFEPPLALTATEESEPILREEFTPERIDEEMEFTSEPRISRSSEPPPRAPSPDPLDDSLRGTFKEKLPSPREDPAAPGELFQPDFALPFEARGGLTPTPVSAPQSLEEEAEEADLPWAEALEDDDPIITPIPPEVVSREGDLPEADALFEESLHFARDPADSAPTLEPEPEPYETPEEADSFRSSGLAPDDSFGEDARYPAAEAVSETVARPSQMEEATWHTPAAAVDPEVLRQTLEKVAWEAFGSLSKELVQQVVDKVEQIAWEVIPQLAERLILDEIAKLRDDPPAE